MQRRYRSKALGLVSLLLFAGLLVLLQPVRSRPRNLLLISIDTLRADHVTCYGYQRRVTTPNLDRLFAAGHAFRLAFSPMPTTLPSHAAMMTSRYPSQLGVNKNGDAVPTDVPTLAEVLRESGLRTGAFVSATPLDRGSGLARGFDVYEDSGDRARLSANERLTAAMAWLEQGAHAPFFLFVHFYDPHTFYDVSEPFASTFLVPRGRQPPDREFVGHPARFTDAVVDGSIRGYDAQIAYVDAAVGRLLAALSRLRLEDSTLVVVTADHGESLAELLESQGYAFDHGEYLYAHQLRVPLILRVPGGKRSTGTMHEIPVSTLDVMPTLLEQMGIVGPAGMRGRSLGALLEGRSQAAVPVYGQRRIVDPAVRPFLAAPAHSVIDWPWHLIDSGPLGTELFDLSTDLEERHDLAKTRAAELERLQASLSSWSEGLGSARRSFPARVSPEAEERLRSLGYVR